MTTTANIGITLIDVNQAQASAAANTALQRIENALTEADTIEVVDGINTVTTAQAQEAVAIVLTAGSPAPGAAFDVVLPAIKRFLIIKNDSGEDAVLGCDGAATGANEATVADGAVALVYCDGTAVYSVSGSSGAGAATQCIPIACSDETTALTTGAGKVTFRMPFAFTLTGVRASVTTAPTGAAISIGINEGGASILSTDLTIDAGEKTSTTATTPAVISDPDLADDAEITIDLDQVGSTVAGAGLKVYLIGSPA